MSVRNLFYAFVRLIIFPVVSVSWISCNVTDKKNLTRENELQSCGETYYKKVDDHRWIEVIRTKDCYYDVDWLSEVTVEPTDTLCNRIQLLDFSDTSMSDDSICSNLSAAKVYRFSSGNILEYWKQQDSVTFNCILDIRWAYFKNGHDSLWAGDLYLWRKIEKKTIKFNKDSVVYEGKNREVSVE